MRRTITLAITLGLGVSISAHDIGHEHEHVEGGWNAEAGFVSDADLEARLWNPRGKSQDVIDERAEYLAQFFDAGRTAEERAADAEIKAIVSTTLSDTSSNCCAYPPRNGSSCKVYSTTLKPSLWIVEMGGNDFSFHIDAARRVHHLHDLTHSTLTIFDEPQANGMTKRRRVGH